MMCFPTFGSRHKWSLAQMENCSFWKTVMAAVSPSWIRRPGCCASENQRAIHRAPPQLFRKTVEILALATPQSIRLVDVASGDSHQIPPPVAVAGGEHFQIALSPDGQKLAATGGFGLQLIDVKTARLLGSVQPVRDTWWGDGLLISVAISPDGRTIATGDTRGIVTFWNASTMAKVREVAVQGRYSIPWTAPATLLGIWVLLHWILIRRGLFLTNAR